MANGEKAGIPLPLKAKFEKILAKDEVRWTVGCRVRILGADNRQVASMGGLSSRSEIEKREYSAFIVRACNSYDALLLACIHAREALEAAQKYSDEMKKIGRGHSRGTDPEFSQIARWCKEAIDQAQL